MRVRLRQVLALTVSGPRARFAWLRRHSKQRSCGPDIPVACCGLTVRSSRRRFVTRATWQVKLAMCSLHYAARLNSGVRPQLATWVPCCSSAICSIAMLPMPGTSVRFSHARLASLSGLPSDTNGSLVANGSPRRALVAVASASQGQVHGRRAQVARLRLRSGAKLVVLPFPS